jgi:tetratricopeptide (TPR) repeat protein
MNSCRFLCFVAAVAILLASPAVIRAQNLPPEAVHAMDQIYAGYPQAAMPILKAMQASHPDDPLGFLLEAEADWWEIYCGNEEVRYGMVDAWKRGKKPEDEAYFALADKVIFLAQAQIAKSDTAEKRVYAGTGYALKARLYALRGDGRAVAHAGVSARAEFLRALEINPNTPDATAGLGLYNYYVDSLPAAVKILRLFMGIPGGDRNEGIREMQVGIDCGSLSRVLMRFYLAKNLRTFDQQYQNAAAVAGPLVARYPDNPVFLLLLGNLNAELNRREKAAQYFRAAMQSPALKGDCAFCSECASHVREIANSFLAELD